MALVVSPVYIACNLPSVKYLINEISQFRTHLLTVSVLK